MKEEAFGYLWEQGIKKAADFVLGGISPEIIAKYAVDYNVSDVTKAKVHAKYEEIRRRIRAQFFNTGAHDENKMDGHKICACITGALLDVRLISFDVRSKDMPEEVYYSNYAIAFWAAIYLLYAFLLSDYLKEGKEDHYNLLMEKGTFSFPHTNPGHDPYIQGRIKTLALNDICGVDYDVLTYADMLFWIERYNRELIDAQFSGN